MGLGRLTGKVAIVTGAARGQGEAQARLFVDEGAKVLLADRLAEDGERVAASLGTSALFVDLDVRDERGWAGAVSACIDAFGGPNILINNAGLFQAARVQDTSAADFTRLFEVNMLGALLGIQAVLPAMRAHGSGSIVNVSSAQGLSPMANLAAYSATKAGLTGLTRAAALDLGPEQIRVNAVHPGAMTNQMVGQGGKQGSTRSRFYDRLPLARPGEVDETAKMVLFVASDDASYATGSCFVSDGGMLSGVLND